MLYKGLVYAAFGSHCDRPPYFPWLFAFNAKTLAIDYFWTSAIFICAPLRSYEPLQIKIYTHSTPLESSLDARALCPATTCRALRKPAMLECSIKAHDLLQSTATALASCASYSCT